MPLPLDGPALPGGLGTLRAGHLAEQRCPGVTTEPLAWDVGAAALGHKQKEALRLGYGVLTKGLTQGPQPSRDHLASQAPGNGRGAGFGGQARPGGGRVVMEGVGPAQGPPTAPSAQMPHGSPPLRPPAGSQNLLQVQIPGEVECASLRLVEVPRDVAVAGKRVTGVRPPVVLHSVSQTSTSVPKTLVTAEG